MSICSKNITETLIIPEGSVERFVRPSAYAQSEDWFQSGVELAGISNLRAGYFVNRPNCNHHVLLFCQEGVLKYECDSLRGELHPGEKLFIPAKCNQRYYSDQDFQMFWFHLSSRHSRWQYLYEIAPQAGKSLCDDELAALMEQLYSEGLFRRFYSDRIVRSICSLVIAYLDSEFDVNITNEEFVQKQYLQKAINAAGVNLKKKWTIVSLARIAGMSNSHFHAVFQRYYGKSPMVVIQQMRIDQAKNMLLHTGLTLEVIAEMAGYRSAFSFSRAFKSFTGISPKMFKKQNNRLQ